MTHRYKNNPLESQPAHTGKVANDTNKQGAQRPTQKNEGRRTPESRHDREAQIGNNQSKMRAGAPQVSGRGEPTKRP